jgi:transcriptional regulator with XRE-family HTH domain
MTAFSEKLKFEMSAQEITQKRLSAALKIPKSSISQWLSGKVAPSAASVKLLETFFDCDFSRNYEIAVPIILKRVTIEEAARRIGKSKRFVRNSLIQGTCPFGYAALMDSGSYDFHISPKKLDEYIGA